jgi:archaellum component FlaD/FlaE
MNTNAPDAPEASEESKPSQSASEDEKANERPSTAEKTNGTPQMAQSPPESNEKKPNFLAKMLKKIGLDLISVILCVKYT